MSEAPNEPQPLEPTEPGEPTEITPDEEAAEEGESGEGHEQPDEPSAPEPETEPPQPEGMTVEQYEARAAKADKRWKSYAGFVEGLWEEDALNLVPLTISPSAPPGYLHAADAGRIPDEVKGPLLSFLGITQEKDYPPDPSKIACDLCHGEGKVSTESHVPSYRVLICRVCNGTGLKPESGTAVNGPTTLPSVPALVGGDEDLQPPADADGFGTPRLLPDGMENPNYGRNPQYWNKEFPIGRGY